MNGVFDSDKRSVYSWDMDALDRAIEHAGGVAELARRIGVVPMAVYQWRKRGVPPKRAIEIEKATGGHVSRGELRPDLFGGDPTGNSPRGVWTEA